MTKTKCALEKYSEQNVFTDTDYNSNNGFSTYIWGPCVWHFLHTISFNYPVKPTTSDKKHYMTFLKSLQYVLPCKSCRKNYIENIKIKGTKLNMSVMKNRDSLSRWMCNLHNKINTQLCKNKKVKYEVCRDFYEQFRARCTKQKSGTHIGCSEPFHKGIKSKTILKIVPRSSKLPTLDIDKSCLCKKT
jgi:hypothetical protein